LLKAEKEINRLAGLIDELLQMTRAEGDPASRKLDSVDLSTLLASTVEDNRVESEARGCRSI